MNKNGASYWKPDMQYAKEMVERMELYNQGIEGISEYGIGHEMVCDLC